MAENFNLQPQGSPSRAPFLNEGHQTPNSAPSEQGRREASNPVAKVYWSISRMYGFREGPSLTLFTILGGALLGFCLSRLMMFSPSVTEREVVPGEWFWYRQSFYKPNIFIHIYATTLGGLFSGIQFIPVVREKYILLHRLNGYFVTWTLILGMVTGGIVARRAFGGQPFSQAAFYFIALSIFISLVLGIINVKQGKIRTHRQWMLRAISYLASVITARLVMFCARSIISNVGSYYSIWRCDEVEFLLKDATAYQRDYPTCTSPSNYTLVRASLNGGHIGTASAVRVTFGMALWVGLVLHMVGTEIYIRYSESLNSRRSGNVLKPRPTGGIESQEKLSHEQ